MLDFVKVIDLNNQVHVIGMRHIVQVYQQHPPDWDVLLTAGDPVTLTTAEAEKLFKPVMAAHHPKEAGAETVQPS